MTARRLAIRRDMVAKALSLLDLLGEYPQGAALSDLAAAVRIPVEHHPPAAGQPDPRRVRVAVGRRPAVPPGLRVFALGQQVASARGFAGTVLPQMEWLSQQTE